MMITLKCQAAHCNNAPHGMSPYCEMHRNETQYPALDAIPAQRAILKTKEMTIDTGRPKTLAEMYPKYHKAIPEGITSIDTYLLNKLFPVDDPTGCVLHARKKLLIPGTRTGGKSFYDDIKEARDTLNRWLEINKV